MIVFTHRQLGIAAVAAATSIAGAAVAHEAHNTEVVEELVVYGRSEQAIGLAQSASEGLVGYDDIALQPLMRVGELVESVPGMVATQHSGTGKANQYFLRGFNLDHGTDFSAAAAGVPLNMRTHGHGQGYLDLNFLIPETVRTTTYRKGPYAAEIGDFSSAGAVAFDFYERLDAAIADVTVGSYDFYRGLIAGTATAAGGDLTAAVDATTYAGPWEINEQLEQYKALASYGFDLGENRVTLMFTGYDGRWDSTDQVPRRAVSSGLIPADGFLDPDLGGQTGRYSLSGSVSSKHWTATGYLIDYDFTLFSNFTYFLDDPVAGDEFEQRDKRRVYGASAISTRDVELGDMAMSLRFGAETRYDDIDEVGLYRSSARVRSGTVRQDAVNEFSIAGFLQAEMALTGKLRGFAGLRGDYYDWEVDALRSPNDGSGDDTLLSPKLALAYRIADAVEGYLNWGRGFHSNDVRGTTIGIDPVSGDPADPVEALVPSEGAELGVRIENGERFNTTLVAFWLELDSELVFVGDAGGTEPSAGSERFGLEASTFWQAQEWLALNASYTLTDAEFDDGSEIPGAVESNFTLGANAVWRNGFSASLRARYLGESPLTEDGSVRSRDSLVVNAGLQWARDAIEIRVDAFNLFDSDDDDIAYFYASRLAGEPAGGVEDIHFHSLEPRAVRASVTYRW